MRSSHLPVRTSDDVGAVVNESIVFSESVGLGTGRTSRVVSLVTRIAEDIVARRSRGWVSMLEVRDRGLPGVLVEGSSDGAAPQRALVLADVASTPSV